MISPILPTIDWLMMAPVSIVFITGIIALIVEMIQPKRNNNLIVGVSLLGLGAAFYSIWIQFGMAEGATFAGTVFRDQTALVLQGILVVCCFLVFLFSDAYLRQRRIAWAEFYPLALWSTAGGMILVSTKSLLMIFLGLEVLSIALYCLAGMAREEQKSEESALKYFLLGAFASAFLLMGIAFIYGTTGSIDLVRIGTVMGQTAPSLVQIQTVGVILMLIGVSFKLALAPFHQWTPDVYQGAPTNVTAFMGSVSKVAAVGMLIRILDVVDFSRPEIAQPLMVLCGLTMVVGNAVALVQKDVKRVLGYSSVANAGYVLLAILAHYYKPETVTLQSVYFFLMAYVVTVIGSFAVVSLAAKGGKEGTRFEDLHGFWKKSPFAAGMLIIFIASQIGIPPTAGFFGKYLVFRAAIEASAVQPVIFWLAIILAVTSAMSAAYYLQIVRAMFVAEEGPVSRDASPASGSHKLTLTLAAAAVFGLAVFMNPVLTAVQAPAKAVAKAALPTEVAGAMGSGGAIPANPRGPLPRISAAPAGNTAPPQNRPRREDRVPGGVRRQPVSAGVAPAGR